MKRERLFAIVLPNLVVVLLALVLTWASTDFFRFYGWTLFVLTPLCCGLVSGLLYNRKTPRTFGASVLTSLFSGLLSLLAFLLLGREGLICMLMAAPLVLPLYMIGGVISFVLLAFLKRKALANTLVVLVCGLSPLLMGLESSRMTAGELHAVRTSVRVKAPAAVVWSEVIEFSPIPEPTEWYFRAGIAYPLRARIEGSGVGAIRHCEFTTGAFVEPITAWEEGRRLAFSVRSQPDPMIELSPYGALRPPHLDTAIRSEKGEFLITPQADGSVELTGTTWYRSSILPSFYWDPMTDALIHCIHSRVLNHIRETVESKTTARLP